MHIICHNLTKTYQQGDDTNVIAVDNCQLDIPQGTLCVLLGVSGSGKTTLLKLLGLLEQPTSGQILFDSVDVTLYAESQRSKVRAQSIGFIYQNYNLISELSVEENILLPCYICGKAYSSTKLKKLMDFLQISHKRHCFPPSLSGGQQQRVAIARALIHEPGLILADEPTGNLDNRTKKEVMKLLLDVQKEYGTTMLVVTHDDSFTEIADRMYVMENGTPTLVS